MASPPTPSPMAAAPVVGAASAGVASAAISASAAPMVGAVDVPASAAAVAAPSGVATGAAPSGGDDDQPVCVICHEVLDVSGNVATLWCGHQLHSDCLAEWRDVGDGVGEHDCPMRCHMSGTGPVPILD